MKPKVVVISFPWKSPAPYKFLTDISKILEPISEKVTIIDGNTERIIVDNDTKIYDIGVSMHSLNDITPLPYSIFIWLVKCIIAQFKMGLFLIMFRKDVDLVIFYLAYPYYLIPLAVSKILGKKTVEIITRSKPSNLSSLVVSFQDPLFFHLLDGISPESTALINDLHLNRYKNKLLPSGARFIDASKYNVKINISDRRNVIGFIGRLTREKGIREFVEAIPLVAKEITDVEFLIGGSGELYEWVCTEAKRIEALHHTRILVTGWIGADLSDYLNDLKLLVLPTYGDAFPTIILEAMACGTPVLVTSVGGIVDLAREGKTAFLLENNTPECIAKNIIKAIENPELERIVNKMKDEIENNYTLESAVSRYRRILGHFFYHDSG